MRNLNAHESGGIRVTMQRRTKEIDKGRIERYTKNFKRKGYVVESTDQSDKKFTVLNFKRKEK